MTKAIIILACDDVEGLATFYQSLLGWQRCVDVGVFVQLRGDADFDLGVYARAGFAANVGGQLPAQTPENAISATELYLLVDQLETSIALALRGGATLLAAASDKPWGDRAAYFRDPAGNVLALAQSIEADEAS